MTSITVSVKALDSRFLEIAEGIDSLDMGADDADEALVALGFVDGQGKLSESGHAYYLARHIRQDPDATLTALGKLLQEDAVANAFCSTLWGVGEIPVTGAVSLLKRLTSDLNENSAKRWLDLMNRGGLIAYNRQRPTLRVLYNPDELVSPEEDAAKERDKGHVVSPETPFGNLLALRELLRAARGHLYWYEQHMEPKVLEVLYREVPKGSVSEIRLLSGPAHVDDSLKADFKRFAREMKDQRDIDAEWRVLSRKEAQMHHDRFFFSDGLARNLPPLNLILRGSVGEILPSDVTTEEFLEWWADGQDLRSVETE